jgi:hypothetical protein
MTQEGNLQMLGPSARRELTIVHRNEYMAFRSKPGMGCMRCLVWGFIFEAGFSVAMILCWWLCSSFASSLSQASRFTQ